jgi:hypothetical protein
MQIPLLDAKLASFERRAGHSRNVCLQLNNAIAATQRAIVETVVRFYVIVIFALYKFSVVVSGVGGVFLPVAAPVLAVRNLTKALSARQRRERWDRIFASALDQKQRLMSKKRARKSDTLDGIWTNLIGILLIVGTDAAAVKDNDSHTLALIAIYAISALLSSERPLLLTVATSLVCAAAEKSRFIIDISQLEDLGVPPSLTMLLMADKFWFVAAFVGLAASTGSLLLGTSGLQGGDSPNCAIIFLFFLFLNFALFFFHICSANKTGYFLVLNELTNTQYIHISALIGKSPSR